MTQTADPFSAALIHHKAGRAREAAALYAEAIDENPAHADALFNLGALLRTQGHLDEAMAYYERVLELAPENAEVLSNLGNVKSAQGRRPEAEQLYRRAIAADPVLAPAHANLGQACADAGRYDEALDHYRRAIELDPGLATAHSNLAGVLTASGRRAEALTHLEQAIRLDPDDAAAHDNLGGLLSDAGKHEAADERLRCAIALRPDWPQAHFNHGVALSKADKPELALEAYREAVRLDPDYAKGLRNGGALLIELGEQDEGRRWLEKSLATDGGDAETLFYLGNLHHQRHEAEQAIEYLERAARADDAIPEIHNNLGNSLRDAGRHDEAVAAARRALALKPDFAQAWNTLGNALMAKGLCDEAVEAYRREVQLDPECALAANNLGDAHRASLRYDEALRWFEEALRIDPDLASAYNGIGLVHQSLNRHDEAMVSLGRALELRPDFAEALNNYAIALQNLGRHGEALQYYRDALAANPDVAEIYFNLGSLLQLLGRYDESVPAFMQALKARPDYRAIFSFLAHSLMHQCSWQNLGAVIASTIAHIEAEIEAGEPVSASAFALQSMPVPLDLRLRTAQEISKKFEARVAPMKAGIRFDYAQPKDGRLRIGYVSPDFRFHSVAVAFKDVLEHHDRDRFELFGYSLTTGEGGPIGRDGLTEFFRQGFDSFTELTSLPFAEAAQTINDDGIDILVDLAGHTRGGRLELFAMRPAPIQVHYLGYSATIGADFIDYLITDRRQVPPENEKYFHEKLVFLPDSFMATTRTEVADERPSRRDCGLPEEGVVFANFNTHYKFDPGMFAIWMRLLRQVPGSVLWLMAGTTTSRENLSREAEARGVAPARLVFAEKVPHGLHLARHAHVDLGLDNQYHGGGVTTVDALWVGVPVVTLAGESPQSRNGASLLDAARLPELITDSIDAYERLALELALEPARLAGLKAKLEADRLSCPLFDCRRLTRHLEIGYRMMWDNYLAGDPPRTMETPPLP